MSERRRLQLESAIQRAVQTTLVKGLNDPRYRGLVTVTAVRLTDDHREAIVSISVFPEEHEALTMHALHDAARHVLHDIADEVPLPRTPEIRFKLDKSIKQQGAVLAAINQAAEELRRKEGLKATDAPAHDDESEAQT